VRMRAIYPDFWSSREFAALSREDRLGLIAVWGYLEDNGVGLDDVDLIAARMFPYEVGDPTTKPWLAACLDTLCGAGIIQRFIAVGVGYLEFGEWDRWQKPKNPSKVKFPRSSFSTSGNADPTETLRRDSVDTTEKSRCSSEFGVRRTENGELPTQGGPKKTDRAAEPVKDASARDGSKLFTDSTTFDIRGFDQ